MTYDEKLEKVIFKLKEERDLTRKGHKTKVVFTDGNFTKIRIREICKILLQLQDDEGVVKILDALQPIETVPTEQIINLSDDDDYEGVEEITAEVGREFDNWLIRYRMQQKSKPENLDWLNLLKALDVCSDVDNQLQVTNTDIVIIPSFPYPYIGRFLELFPYDTIGTRKTYQQYRWEGAQYLIKEKAIFEAKYDNSDTFGYGSISIRVDLENFDDFHTKIKQEFEKRKQKATKIDKKDVGDLPKQETIHKTDEKDGLVYQVTYTKQRQVLMNNAQIGRPDFNSENDLVFSFLYEHPNKRVTRTELEKAISGKLTKSLHKIIENLGFEGDTKEVFFSVSKNAIEFRNPITKKDLEEMGKPLIKLIKGGGKLVIPH